MHLKAATPSMIAPRTRPDAVSTTGAVCVPPVTMSSIFVLPLRVPQHRTSRRRCRPRAQPVRCHLLTLSADSAGMVGDIAAGSRVSARGLAWDVTEVMPLGAQTLLRLRCVSGDLGGLEWDILHPTEPVEVLREELRPEAAGHLSAW